MKRKLDANDEPSADQEMESTGPTGPDGRETSRTIAKKTSDFDSFGLDPRLLKAIAKQNYVHPTPIQSESIPRALEGKNILARSKTGSGKTAAYILPILHSLLKNKSSNNASKATTALILVPTRELAQQVFEVVNEFTTFCTRDIRSINIAQKLPEAVQRSLLAECPELVIATPARAAQNIQCSALSLENVTHLVIDEADLILSYGYDEDLRAISSAIPKGIQTSLVSATLTTEVNTLKGLFCRDPLLLDIGDPSDDSNGISQFVVKCSEEDKFLLAYVIFKLKLIKGKCIVFVGEIDRCYRLKLFFEQFGIKSCILNSELPVNSRLHVIEAFNKNVYDIIIAADEHEVLEIHKAHKVKSSSTEPEHTDEEAPHDDLSAVNGTAETTTQTNGQEDQHSDEGGEPTAKRHTKKGKRKEYGISRGIDFQNVSCVLNFDLPTTPKSYTHRIGRTARAGKTGMVLSFAIPSELYHKHPATSLPSGKYDEEVLEKITKHRQKKGQELKPYHFDMQQVDAFRYRMNDALRAVTRMAIREARTRELRQELLNSEKLKRHFEENPDDLHHLRHDGELRGARIQQHLKHVPDYLMPTNGNKGITQDDVGFVGLRKPTDNRIRKARAHNRMRGKGRNATTKRSDPLKTFNARGRR